MFCSTVEYDVSTSIGYGVSSSLSNTVRHFKTLSLDELRSPDFNLLSDPEYSKEEETKAMAETMEQYMNNEDANEHIEEVLKIVDLFHVPNITMDQLMLRVFPISLTGAASRWLRNEPTGSIKTWEYLKTKFLNKYCPLGRTTKKMEEINNFQQQPDPLSSMGILDSRGAIPTMTAADTKTTSNGLAAIQAQLNNLRRDIKKVNEKVYAAQVGCEQCRGPNYTKYCPLKEEWKTLEEAYYTQFGGPFQGGGYRAIAPGKETRRKFQFDQRNPSYDRCCHKEPRSIDQNFRNTNQENEQADLYSIRRIGSSQYAVSTRQNSTLLYKSRQMTVPFLSRLDNHYYEEEEGNYGPKFTESYRASHINNIIPRKEKDPGNFIILDMPEDIKVPLILERPFLSIARAKIDVYKRKITLRVREENIIFKSVKPASSLIKRFYMLSLKERMELDLEARLMGETLVLNRSLDPFLEDYIELNDLNEPFELRRNQEDDLVPTIEEGEVIKEFRTRVEDLDSGIDDYPSYCDDDKKIHIDCAHNLKFSCMIGFEFTHVNFFLLLYVTVMSKKFHNLIMKNKMVYKGDNVVGALMNVSIFVGTFSVMTDFAVLEDMDAYRDEGIGDIIVGEPFLREVGIKTKRFEGMITIYNGDDEVSEKDKRNGISHAYQKLKGFYKGVLNLGPEYIQDAKTKEWLTRGHISVHEME
ncbi:homeodomain-like protein [Tanacetum coccineum]|uniref:Homeodomain-like protein n=1 Tax=Tanacetum coccineum TaxID=301880 RepID=A0ABQ5DSG0_9ASTR